MLIPTSPRLIQIAPKTAPFRIFHTNQFLMLLLQWNVNGFFKRLPNLQILLTKYKPKIVCLQETHFKTNQCHSLKGYTSFFRNRTDIDHASGGVAIYISSDVTTCEIPLNTDLEAVAVSINDSRKLTLCNLYIPPNRKFDLNEITDLVNQLPTPCILVGDWNSHNVIWGSEKTDSRGRIFETSLSEQDLVLLNTGEKTRFNASTGTFSAIDISVCSPFLAADMNWEIEPHLYDSDHFPICILHQVDFQNGTFQKLIGNNLP